MCTLGCVHCTVPWDVYSPLVCTSPLEGPTALSSVCQRMYKIGWSWIYDQGRINGMFCVFYRKKLRYHNNINNHRTLALERGNSRPGPGAGHTHRYTHTTHACSYHSPHDGGICTACLYTCHIIIIINIYIAHIRSFTHTHPAETVSSLGLLLEITSVFDQLDESLPVDSISLHGGNIVHLLDLKQGDIGVTSAALLKCHLTGWERGSWYSSPRVFYFNDVSSILNSPVDGIQYGIDNFGGLLVPGDIVVHATLL
eukprot:sb/3468592/